MAEAFRRGRGGCPGGRPGGRLVAQVGLNWAPNEAEALAGAHEQWRTNVPGGEVNWRLRTPEELDTASRHVRPEDTRESLRIPADLGRHAARIAELAELGFEEIQLHQVGRNQREFVEAFGAGVLPRPRG